MQHDPVIPPAASGSEARLLLRSLISEKDALELQLEALHSQSQVGQPLVDAEGYPRADVDVHAIRTARSELARMQTDHKALMGRIEVAMFALHAEAKAAKAVAHPELQQSVQQVRSGAGAQRTKDSDEGVPPAAASDAAAAYSNAATAAAAAPAPASAIPAGAASLRPFYTVNSVSDDSPASVAGLRAGDLILQFGSVTSANASAASMAAVVSSSVGRALPVTVRRGEQIKQLRLIPQAWGGRGMLGSGKKYREEEQGEDATQATNGEVASWTVAHVRRALVPASCRAAAIWSTCEDEKLSAVRMLIVIVFAAAFIHGMQLTIRNEPSLPLFA